MKSRIDAMFKAAWRYGMGARDRILVEARFSATVQTGPIAHPASYTMSTRSFPRVRWPRCGVDHPPLSMEEVKERVELYLYSPSLPSWPVLVLG
jgi:hypothetical protein